MFVLFCYLCGFTVWRDWGYTLAAIAGIILAFHPSVPPWGMALVALWAFALPFVFGIFGVPFLLMFRGHCEPARRISVILSRVCISSDQRLLGLTMEMGALSFSGRTAEALKASERVSARLPRWPLFDTRLAAALSDVRVNAGRYREAIDVIARFTQIDPWTPTTLLRSDAAIMKLSFVTARLNALEAMVNLGQAEETKPQLAALAGLPGLHPYAQTWITLHRAWMLAREGAGESALQALEALGDEPRALSPCYFSELAFVRAMALMTLERFAEARAAIGRGLERAMRASSRRNGKFLMGICARREGQLEEAVRWFQDGVDDLYQGQGGEELVAYGDTLKDLGRVEEAKRVYRMVLERDPQSAAATVAQERLTGLAGTI